LVTKQSRVKTKSGNAENDSNIYQLTPRRIWLAEIKQRSEALEVATQAARLLKSAGTEQRGGGTRRIPPPIIPAIPPSTLSVPKVSSIEVLQSFEVNSNEASSQEPKSPLVKPPVIGAAAAPSSDGFNTTPAEHSYLEGGEDLPEFFTASSQIPAKPENDATSFEAIPAGGAAPKYAILGLQAIPQAVLAARPARDPERMPQLRALLSARHKSRLPHLMAQLGTATQTGGLP